MGAGVGALTTHKHACTQSHNRRLVPLLTQVICPRTSKRRFLERVYELPHPYHRKVHTAGGHLCMGMVGRALPGCDSEEDKVALLDLRRAAARTALDAMARGSQPVDVGARKLTELNVCPEDEYCSSAQVVSRSNSSRSSIVHSGGKGYA